MILYQEFKSITEHKIMRNPKCSLLGWVCQSLGGDFICLYLSVGQWALVKVLTLSCQSDWILEQRRWNA